MGKTGIHPMREARLRQRIHIAGRIRCLRGKTDRNAANRECEITDGTGSLLLVFQGRRRIPGIAVGALLVAADPPPSWGMRPAR